MFSSGRNKSGWGFKQKTISLMLVLVFLSMVRYIHTKMLKDEIIGKKEQNPEVLCMNQDGKLSKSKGDEDLACAKYYDSEGWHIFSVETYPGSENEVKARVAGYLEGYLYAKYINYHFRNINATIFKNIPLSSTTKQFIKEQTDYTSSYRNNKQYDPDYLETLILTQHQLEGIYEGYVTRQRTDPDEDTLILPKDEFHLITMQGDLEDLIPALEPQRVKLGLFRKEKDCSGYVKYIPSKQNLIVGHDTHNLYTLMNRIYKHYSLGITLSSGRKLNDFKYSSRPGDLTSKDDYYILSNRMVVLETSLEIKDYEIYKNLSPKTIPKWMRVNIANRLCKDNEDWINLFFRENSGTHNNQWLIVDYNMFDRYIQDPSAKPKKIVHLVEQIPVLNEKYFEDFSERLIQNSYVASYNAPYFSEVIEKIGYKSSGDYFHARRYEIFMQLDPQVNDIEGVKETLRFHSNKYLCDTISPRCDMVENRPFGGVDAKVTDKTLIDDMLSHIIYGPPHKEGVSEPFDFSKYPEYLHLGIPEIFDFKWIVA